MGTWDIGHFDNDTAADFGGHLDDAPSDKREALLRDALTAVTGTGPAEYLDSDEGAVAVAAAALIAAQCPGGEPVTTAYGPDEPLPPLAPELRALAVSALDRVAGARSELPELWAEAGASELWAAGIARLREVLARAAG
ncbi:DUF4259 domain-containing protein [Streptomyces finlayi]|uniref:DUF4259 domain-containing protein n=1 Tax=Streptomyces finlayi TaxID=67296 RepID=A0A7G7BV82_9ACTN|nr:DUF4259 domain-containing protein [Streptomyces finlayi]QNE79247.1 DUF4259 domain-containing protein [Streptomyces finlayi]